MKLAFLIRAGGKWLFGLVFGGFLMSCGSPAVAYSGLGNTSGAGGSTTPLWTNYTTANGLGSNEVLSVSELFGTEIAAANFEGVAFLGVGGSALYNYDAFGKPFPGVQCVCATGITTVWAAGLTYGLAKSTDGGVT